MDALPDFFLTAAGEYAPLAEPRACWVTHCLRDSRQNEYLVVEIQPALRAPELNAHHVSTLILSPRHRGESLTHITSWPIYVYVYLSRTPGAALSSQECFDGGQLETIAWAQLHPRLEGAAKHADQHAAATGEMRFPETIHARQVRFLGEQDGIPEQALKDRLVLLFEQNDGVWKAYLAKVDFGPGTQAGVTLCLRTLVGPNAAIVRQIGTVFSALFNTRTTLDVLFLDTEQERDLAPMCKPFYVYTAARPV